jgi:hypothetical protein
MQTDPLPDPVEVFRRSLLPAGRIDLAIEAPGYSDSGLALADKLILHFAFGLGNDGHFNFSGIEPALAYALAAGW